MERPHSLGMQSPFGRSVMTSLACVLLTSCTSFQSPRGELAPASLVRLEALSSTPVVVALRATDGSPTFQYCNARLIEGPISSVVADTLIFSRLDRVESADTGDQACVSIGAARTVLRKDSGHRLRVAESDSRLTLGTGLLIGVALALSLGVF